MGNQKLKWTTEEEDALLAGIAKHGPGKWKNILRDPQFAPHLTHHSNIDLSTMDGVGGKLGASLESICAVVQNMVIWRDRIFGQSGNFREEEEEERVCNRKREAGEAVDDRRWEVDRRWEGAVGSE